MPARYQGTLTTTPRRITKLRDVAGPTAYRPAFPERVAYLLPGEAGMVRRIEYSAAAAAAWSTGAACQRASFATQLEAAWFAAHLADQEPRVARIAGAWVVTVPNEPARGARGLPAASGA